MATRNPNSISFNEFVNVLQATQQKHFDPEAMATSMRNTLSEVFAGRSAQLCNQVVQYAFGKPMLRKKHLTSLLQILLGDKEKTSWRDLVALYPGSQDTLSFGQYTQVVDRLRALAEVKKFNVDEAVVSFKVLIDGAFNKATLMCLCQHLSQPVLLDVNWIPGNLIHDTQTLLPPAPMRYHTVTDLENIAENFSCEAIYEGQRYAYLKNRHVEQFEPELKSAVHVPHLFADNVQTFGVDITVQDDGAVVVHDLFNIFGIDCTQSTYASRRAFLEAHLVDLDLLAQKVEVPRPEHLNDVVFVKLNQTFDSGKRRLFRVKARSERTFNVVGQVDSVHRAVWLKPTDDETAERKLYKFKNRCWEAFQAQLAKRASDAEALVIKMAVVNQDRPILFLELL